MPRIALKCRTYSTHNLRTGSHGTLSSSPFAFALRQFDVPSFLMPGADVSRQALTGSGPRALPEEKMGRGFEDYSEFLIC